MWGLQLFWIDVFLRMTLTMAYLVLEDIRNKVVCQKKKTQLDKTLLSLPSCRHNGLLCAMMSKELKALVHTWLDKTLLSLPSSRHHGLLRFECVIMSKELNALVHTWSSGVVVPIWGNPRIRYAAMKVIGWRHVFLADDGWCTFAGVGPSKKRQGERMAKLTNKEVTRGEAIHR